jgi:hypothetical protein
MQLQKLSDFAAHPSAAPALREAMAGSDAVCLRELTAGVVPRREHPRME